MSDYEFPSAPEIENAFRAAYRALEALAGKYVVSHEKDLICSEVISLLPGVLREAEMAAAAQLGPRIRWQAPPWKGDWDLFTAVADLDASDYDSGEPDFVDGAFEGPDGTWNGCSLERAAYAYKREAGWDFTPGSAGVWVMMIAPVSASGSEHRWFYAGHLVGFVILHDRDEDGEYESIAHIWTASAWRRRGIAKRLLAEARDRFPIAGVEGPYTADGAAFLAACPPTVTSVEEET